MTERISRLPRPGTPEFEKEKEFFLTSTYFAMKRRAKELGMQYRNYKVFFARKGIKRDWSIPIEQDAIAGGDISSKPGGVPNGGLGGLDGAASVITLSEVEQKVLQLVKDRPVSVGEISRLIDRSSETVIKIIDELRAKHYEVEIDEIAHEVYVPVTPRSDFKPTEFKYFRKFYRIGVVSDTHLCSKYQQLTLLHDAYKIFDERKVDFIIHAGDIIDGVNMYRGHYDELFLADAASQLKYAVENYPKSNRETKTYIIGGQHDYCYIKQNGYNILEHICEQRPDFAYRGFFHADFNVKGLPLSVQHPGGGVAYARSYRPQKIVEGISGYILARIRQGTPAEDVKNLPIVTFFGHWHVTLHLPSYMGTDTVSLPCCQSQTKYLQQKGLLPDVGCVIAEIWLNENDSLGSVKMEFINMNGRIKDKDY